MVALILALVSIAIISYRVELLSQNNASANGLSSKNTRTLISTGTEYQVNDGAFLYIEFSLNSTSAISGSFSSTAGITIYVIYSVDNSSFGSHGVPTYYLYTTGHVENGAINARLNAGSYDLMMANDNGLNAASIVTFTTNLTCTT